MRLGLDLRNRVGDELIAQACEADELGLWAVLVSGAPGTESTIAAELASCTTDIHIAMWIAAESAHPHTLAEEIAIVDQLARRRALAVIDGDLSVTAHVRDLLAGHVVGGAVLAPPPAQTAVPVWSAADVVTADLLGDLDSDRAAIDTYRNGGETHIFVAWPGATRVLARHLLTRAATPDFPQIVADQADIVAPHD